MGEFPEICQGNFTNKFLEEFLEKNCRKTWRNFLEFPKDLLEGSWDKFVENYPGKFMEEFPEDILGEEFSDAFPVGLPINSWRNFLRMELRDDFFFVNHIL